MNIEPKMVMPPIYRFDLPGCPEESAWGWHRATDLVEVANNIRATQDKPALSAEDIGVEYDKAQPLSYFNVIYERDQSFCAEEDSRYKNLCLGLPSEGHKWLSRAVHEKHCFMPAMLGMRLINEIKKQPKSLLSWVRTVVVELAR